jgi:hypothetical protein
MRRGFVVDLVVITLRVQRAMHQQVGVVRLQARCLVQWRSCATTGAHKTRSAVTTGSWL